MRIRNCRDASPSTLFLSAPAFAGEEKKGWADLLCGALLLFLGLMGTAWSFVSAFSLDVSLWVPACVAACAAILLAAAIRWHFADILLFVLSAALCLFLWRYQEEIVQGFLLTVNSITKTYTEHSVYVFPTFLTEELTPSEARQCSAMFLGACMVPVAGALSWSVIRARSFVFSFLFTFPFQLSFLMFTVTPDLRSVAMLLVFWTGTAFFSARGRGRGRARRSVCRGRLPAGVFLSIAFASGLIAALFAAVPAETYERPARMDELRSSLETALRDFSRRAVIAADFTGNKDRSYLQGRTPGFSGGTVLLVRSSLPADLRLRGFTGCVYDGVSWSTLSDGAYASIEEELGGTFPLSLPGLLMQNFTGEIRLSVENVGGDDEILYLPDYPCGDLGELEGVDLVHDLFLRQEDGASLGQYDFTCLDPDEQVLYGDRVTAALAFLNLVDLGSGEQTEFYPDNIYTLDGTPDSLEYLEQLYRSPVPDAVLDSLPEPLRTWAQQEASYSSFVYDHYLEVPDGLRERLASSFGMYGWSTFEDALAWVEYQVNLDGTYTLDPPHTPAGKDFVEYFLFEDKQGYCVHYATATVLTLRALGIPARYVEGFCVTADELADAGPEGWVQIPDTRSHAWAEAYCPGFGWVPVDATPGGATAQEELASELETSSSPQEETSSAPASEPESSALPSSAASSEASRPVSSAAAVSEREPASGSAAVWRVLLTVLLVLLACAVAVLFFLLRRSLREKRLRSLPPSTAMPIIYRRALHAVRFGAAMDPRLRELAEKAKFSRNGVTEEERGEALSLLAALFEKTRRELPLWKRVLFFLYLA